MTIRRVLAALTICAALVLAVTLSLLAQTRTPAAKDPRPVPPPGTRYLTPSASTPAGETPYAPSNPYTVQPAFGSQVISPLPVPGAPIASLAAKVELTSGLVLTGQVPGESLHCQATFGAVAIPLATIRGLRLHDPDASATDEKPAGPSATVILTNGDSLTVALRAAQVQVKTEWGMAIVDVPHVRSLVLTTAEVQWQQSDGRWILAPTARPPAEASEAPAEAVEAPAGTTTPRIIIQDEDEAKLGIELP